MTAPESSAPARVVIGVDIGTTAAKVVAFGLDRVWQRSTAVREYPLLRPRSGWRVQDPDAVLAATFDALSECVSWLDSSEVVAISVSTAMHALIGLDDLARPVTPIVTWADARAREQARELRGTDLGQSLHRRSGTPIHSMSPLVKLRWFAAHDPETARRVTTWAGLKDLILHRLTGRLVTELSSASGTGLLNLATRTWDPQAVHLAGIRPDQLAEVLPTTAVLPLAAAADSPIITRVAPTSNAISNHSSV
jgi:gluconokinase